MDNWLSVAWDGLPTLSPFAEASAKGPTCGDFLGWCKGKEPRDRPFPAAKVAMREPDQGIHNDRLRMERMLRVPKEVHPDGKVFLQAHLKIGLGNTIAPDRTSTTTVPGQA
ncbi:hypothetical protein ACFYNX_03410 [Streptomyces sp. NPDC007872]|uniref:hypothetical protein n=1 Tax=Streptomyces sp. NPDC007872 TaxID=3364782 RepID=UPI0036BF7FC9